MRRLLWVGDAGCESGFAKATHHICESLSTAWEVHVLGLNYRGDPHPFQKIVQLYPAMLPGSAADMFGVRRVAGMIQKIQPEVVVIQNDPWNIPAYMQAIGQLKGVRPLIVGAIALDGYNCPANRWLNELDHVVFWVEFAAREARAGGLTKPFSVIPLGVDREIFKPGDQLIARETMNKFIPERQLKAKDFVVVNVNRNQPRKRMDLTIRYFANWVKQLNVPDAKLYLHVAPTGDLGYDCEQLAEYYGVGDLLFLAEPELYHGTSEEWVVRTYQLADVQISNTQGEGFGLTTLEGMACGIPQLAPAWSGLKDWASEAAELVICNTISTTPRANIMGGVPDEEQMITALDKLYREPSWRAQVGARGYARAREDRFSWSTIGQQWNTVLDDLMHWKPNQPRVTECQPVAVST